MTTHAVGTQCSVPHIMDFTEFFKESELDDKRGKEYAKKFEENQVLCLLFP